MITIFKNEMDEIDKVRLAEPWEHHLRACGGNIGIPIGIWALR